MARGVNKCILVGNVGKDPEVRYSPSGSAIANFSIATSEQWKDKDSGQKQERVEWHRIVAFNRLAEIVGEYVKKGSQVYIEGSLRTRKWEKDGHTNYTTEIVASEMQMLGGRGAGGEPARDEGKAAGESKPAPSGNLDDFDDDIPFD